MSRINENMQGDTISVFSNTLGEEELSAVGRVFESRWLGKGNECDAFERELALSLAVSRFILTNSGTAAVNLAVNALGLEPGDEVIVSSINFVGCANAVVAAGAIPVFADVDPHTLNVSADEIARVKTSRTRAVILLHYGGHPCDMAPILDACRDCITLIEDAAIAFPANYRGQSPGTIGDIGIFSFDAMKSLAMGDGGGLFVRDYDMRERILVDRYLGMKAGNKSGLQNLRDGAENRWWEFEVEQPSGRHISNDILAAIGRVQLRRLPEFVTRRREIWEFYQSAFSDVPGLTTPPEPLEGCESSHFLYWLQAGAARDELARYLADNGVYCTFRYHPLHQVAFYGSKSRLPGAEFAGETTLNIPLHQNLDDEDLAKIADLIIGFFRRRTPSAC